MSTSSSTACSSSPTSISIPTTESSSPPASSSTSSSPPKSRRKSPPPPKLNLDELKPILPASLATSGTSTSFVFTSSRTLRSLHNHSRSLNDAHPPTPSAEIPSSPQGSVPDSPSSTTSSPSSPHSRKNPKPVLSSVQLARHSQGAVDARCIVSSNMRAAGFVPLAHTPLTGPYTSIPSTPGSSSSIPTPMDPPRFPPIVFVNPTNVTSTSMWEYQRSFTYGPARGSSNGLGLSIDEATVPIRPSLSSEGSTLDKTSQSMSSFSSSHSSLFYPATASSSRTSITSQSPPSPDKKYAHHRRVHSAESFEPVVDGFPFPHTPPRTRNQPQSRIQGDTSPLQLLERITQSPSTSCSTASGSVTPLAASPASSFASLPSTSSIAIPIGRNHSASSSRSSTRFSSASDQNAPSQRPDLSLTELCSTSPRAWVADPVLLPPFSSSRREAVKTRTRVISRTASGKEAIRKGIAAETILEEPEKRLAAAETMIQSDEAHTSTQKRSSALLPPIILTAQKVDDVRLEKGKFKEQERHRGREKDRDHDREKARDKDREKRKTKAAQRSHSSSSPNSTASSSGREDKGSERSSRKSRDRTRSTKEKALGYSAYSSFSFPPRESRDSKSSTAHTLGGRDVVLEREREWAAGEHAKDIVLAHRERDREHARQTESWHSVKDVHGTHKKRYAGPEGALAAPLTFSTAYDSGYGRGIGRGRGRGEHAGLRGRSGKNAAYVAPSIVSEGETMVQEQLEIPEIATDA